MEITDSGGTPLTDWAPGPGLAVYHAGVLVICELAGQFRVDQWAAPTPCPEWRAADLAGHLRCVADDCHEYLDDAPRSRLARLMATGAEADRLARKVARQNAAELAALADGAGPQEHIAAFAAAAWAYARRAVAVWDLPHHRYRDTGVTVGGMVGAACVEWHLHAWDLARSLGLDYQPADPHMLVAGWRAGLPHRPLAATPALAACGAGRAGAAAGPGGAGGRDVIAGATAGPPSGGMVWHALLRASGRLALSSPGWEGSARRWRSM